MIGGNCGVMNKYYLFKQHCTLRVEAWSVLGWGMEWSGDMECLGVGHRMESWGGGMECLVVGHRLKSWDGVSWGGTWNDGNESWGGGLGCLGVRHRMEFWQEAWIVLGWGIEWSFGVDAWNVLG